MRYARRLSNTRQFFHWPLEFPEVFEGNRTGFDVVLGNPPWEQIQPEEIKFFAARGAPEIAELSGAKRKAAIERLSESNPNLATEWDTYQRDIHAQAEFIRASGRFPLTAIGKLNTYAIFAEQAQRLIAPEGSTGIIVPSGIATDDSTKSFFGDLVQSQTLASLYDFENRAGIFPAVDSRMKFCLLTMTGRSRPVTGAASFAFFLHSTEQLRDADRAFTLSAADFMLLNPNTKTCPTFRTVRDAELTKAIYNRVPVLIREAAPASNSWNIEFRQGLFNMTSDSHLFRTRAEMERDGWRLDGSVFCRGDEAHLPLYEGKMVQAFDHRAASVITNLHNLHRPNQPLETTPEQHADPYFEPEPHSWVNKVQVEARLAGRWTHPWMLGWKDITSTTNERTVIASILPRVGVGHKFPLMFPDNTFDLKRIACLYANLNSFILDFASRQKIGGTSLTYFYMKQFPVLSPPTYDQICPWSSGQAMETWLASRVLELTYTAWDLRSFAQDMGYTGPPFAWDTERRFSLRCQLDAAFFHLYGISRDDVAYIMDTFSGSGGEGGVRGKDMKQYGEYRTKRVILEQYDTMAEAINSNERDSSAAASHG